MADWRDELWKAAKEVVKKGGELKLTVSRRGQSRLVIIQKYPDNRIQCNEVTVLDDD